jgi:hypothetical protein
MNVASKVLADPATRSGLVTASPGPGTSTKMSGRRSSKSARLGGGSTTTPSPPIALTGCPSSRKRTARTDENWVSVKTTCATRACIEKDPPPAAKSAERSTVATPSAIARSFKRVPGGISVLRPKEISWSVGPASSSCRAAVPIRGVSPTARRATANFS